MKKVLITITLIATMAVAAKRVRALELKIDELDNSRKVDPKKVAEMVSSLRSRRERFTHF